MINIFIVDDETHSRNGISSLLESRYSGRVEIHKASSGKIALALAETIQPDLVISDIVMPQMNGIDMAKEMQKSFPDTLFIMISAYVELEFYRAALKLHAVSFVEKPIVPEELLHEVSMALSRIEKEKPQKKAFLAFTALTTKVIEVIKLRLGDHTLTLKAIAAEIGMSESYLGDRFKKETGMTIGSYINEARMEMAKVMLSDPTARISDVSAQVGFDDPEYFAKRFKQYTGKNPSSFRREQ